MRSRKLSLLQRTLNEPTLLQALRPPLLRGVTDNSEKSS